MRIGVGQVVLANLGEACGKLRMVSKGISRNLERSCSFVAASGGGSSYKGEIFESALL